MSNRVENWNFSEVSVWLCQIGLAKFVDSFLRHEIDGEVLLSMTETDLYSSALNITTFGDIRKFGVAIKKLKSENKVAHSMMKVNLPRLHATFRSTFNGSLVENKVDYRQVCVRNDSEPAIGSSSDTEYDNDIDAALNGAAFVGGYDEDLDIIFSDDDDREERLSIPPLDEETEMKVMQWVENMKM